MLCIFPGSWKKGKRKGKAGMEQSWLKGGVSGTRGLWFGANPSEIGWTDCSGNSCGHKRETKSGCQFSQVDIWLSPCQRVGRERVQPRLGGGRFRGSTWGTLPDGPQGRGCPGHSMSDHGGTVHAFSAGIALLSNSKTCVAPQRGRQWLK